MPLPKGMLLCLGILLMTAGGLTVLCVGMPYQSATVFAVGVFLGLGGVGLLVSGLCMAMKNLQVAVPGHFLLHPRTGTRFSPQQAMAIQRRLDRIRREMSADSVSRRPEPVPSLPSTPPPWTMEPPPSYDTVMKSQENKADLRVSFSPAALAKVTYQPAGVATMVEGKPYRYGLIAAGLCVAAVGLFIMTQERPHIYATMCALGVTMVCAGTVWSLCQCYPKVILAAQIHEKSLEDLVCTSAEARDERHPEALPGFCGQKSSSSRLLPEALKSQCHSCPTLHLV